MTILSEKIQWQYNIKKTQLKFLKGISRFFPPCVISGISPVWSLIWLSICCSFGRDLHNFVCVILSIRCSDIFASYGCHYGFENRFRQRTVLSLCGKQNHQQSEPKYNSKIKTCSAYKSGNIIRRPMPYFSGMVKKRFCERSNFPLRLLIRCALI